MTVRFTYCIHSLDAVLGTLVQLLEVSQLCGNHLVHLGVYIQGSLKEAIECGRKEVKDTFNMALMLGPGELY